MRDGDEAADGDAASGGYAMRNYWIIKNSWGAGWGADGGYIKIRCAIWTLRSGLCDLDFAARARVPCLCAILPLQRWALEGAGRRRVPPPRHALNPEPLPIKP